MAIEFLFEFRGGGASELVAVGRRRELHGVAGHEEGVAEARDPHTKALESDDEGGETSDTGGLTAAAYREYG